MSLDPAGPASALETGRAALARGAWDEARAALEHAVTATPEDPAAWEALGVASAWVQDTPRTVEARQRAYARYRELGDDRSGARLALELASDYFELLGDMAVGSGWIQRARRLLDTLPEAREHALLAVWDAYLALLGEQDTQAARTHAERAVAISNRVGAADTGIVGLALHGLARVSEGHVPEGMALLDEAVAAALGGELDEPQTFFLACCCMIDACDRVRDYNRAMQWCDRLTEFSARWRVQAFLTTCRLKYIGVLLWRGEWQAAEQLLARATEELGAARPAGLPAAYARLAELRCRQGRHDDAAALLDRISAHPMAMPIRATLALETGDAASAIDLLNVVLRRVPAHARTERAAALELMARAQSAAGNAAHAEAAVVELEAIAGTVETDPLRAAALAARGRVDAAADRHTEARHHFADALALYASSGSPYEAARIRVELAATLLALGVEATARTEAAAAMATLETIGAAHHAQRARELLRRMPAGDAAATSPGTRAAKSGPTLTRRQKEVLALIAEGCADREIADRLVLSEHTIHRHVANILMRLDAPTRTAAVATAFRNGIL